MLLFPIWIQFNATRVEVICERDYVTLWIMCWHYPDEKCLQEVVLGNDFHQTWKTWHTWVFHVMTWSMHCTGWPSGLNWHILAALDTMRSRSPAMLLCAGWQEVTGPWRSAWLQAGSSRSPDMMQGKRSGDWFNKKTVFITVSGVSWPYFLYNGKTFAGKAVWSFYWNTYSWVIGLPVQGEGCHGLNHVNGRYFLQES